MSIFLNYVILIMGKKIPLVSFSTHEYFIWIEVLKYWKEKKSFYYQWIKTLLSCNLEKCVFIMEGKKHTVGDW